MSEIPEFEGGTEEPIDTDVVIETPEHVRFRHALAGPARRGFAWIADTALRSAIFAVIVALATVAGSDTGRMLDGVKGGFLWLLAFALEWGYFVVFETLWNGQTPGKRLLGLRVVSASGRPLGFVDSVLRNILRAADFLPSFYALGVAVVAFDAKFRRLGDFVAGTLVVVEDRRGVGDALPRLETPTADELAKIPAHVMLLPAEVDAVELYLRRRPRLPESRAVELADLAATAIAKRAGVRYRSAPRFLEVLYYRALGGARGGS